ncbi:MAG: hypothetical protein JF886_12980 [Candidatus Dormibacteraeota bacterium]|uniref:Uncharacterized protein n=1 Tax=Candidatus Aeolococcus gillhamiae TaxID=3127015 RepID=A0A2W6ACQ5_9BACT|nr:hypothetical protein [Candidatus Dormibacteraeota bacterium]PZR83088.1 MAG: hypothetical protein DLM65_02765 [Candidatus Dormibacter sp. RRmetagenome_bin12]
MHAVVNHLHFNVVIDPALFVKARNDLEPQMRTIDKFESFFVVQTSDKDAFLVIVAENAETLDQIATQFGSPWMRANVLPLLARPPERHIGPVVTSTQYP